MFHPGLVTLFSLRLASLVIISALVRSIYPRLHFFFWKAPVMELDVVWSLSFDHLTYRSFRFSLDSTYTYRRRRYSSYHDGQRHSTYLVPTTTHRMRTMAARTSRRVGPRLLASVNPSTCQWTHNYLLNHSHKPVNSNSNSKMDTTNEHLQKTTLGGRREKKRRCSWILRRAFFFFFFPFL